MLLVPLLVPIQHWDKFKNNTIIINNRFDVFGRQQKILQIVDYLFIEEISMFRYLKYAP